MAARTPPPRIRTRLSRADEGMLKDLAELVITEELPEAAMARVRTLAARRSPESMPYVYETMFKLRMAGVLWVDVARRLGVHEQTIYKWNKGMVEWLRKQHTTLDPGDHYSKVMHSIQVRRERFMAIMLNIRVMDADGNPIHSGIMATTKINGELIKLDEMERRWMQHYGYFDVFTFGRLSGAVTDSPEDRASAVSDALDRAFGQAVSQGEGDDWDEWGKDG